MWEVVNIKETKVESKVRSKTRKKKKKTQNASKTKKCRTSLNASLMAASTDQLADAN